MKWGSILAIGAAAAAVTASLSTSAGAAGAFDGVTLNLASQNDQFAPVLAALAPKFKEATGATVKVDILSYPELLTKTTTDFVGHTKGYDLVTMDIVMPKMDGVSALRQLRQECPEARVVMVSAVDQREKLTECIRLGVIDFIVKPFDKIRLKSFFEKYARE